MFPLGLSLLDIALMAVIAIILTFYAVFLVKLKPAKENKPVSNVYFEKKGKTFMKSKKPEKPQTPPETKKITNEKPASPVETQKIPEDPTEDIQTRAHVETEENQKKKKDNEGKKSFFLFGKASFEGCPHKFGYLSTLPKSTPIPDECFGCPRILECLRTLKK